MTMTTEMNIKHQKEDYLDPEMVELVLFSKNGIKVYPIQSCHNDWIIDQCAAIILVNCILQ